MKIRTFIKKFSTDEACRAHLESVRWPEGPICPRCGTVAEATTVANKPGYWQCRPCGKQFSVTAGTPMHGTHLPLSVWYLAMYLILASSKGISAVKLGEQLGVQYRTAWHLGHRIRAMLASGEKPILSGLGVWHQVSPKHLHRYASEHEFRKQHDRTAPRRGSPGRSTPVSAGLRRCRGL